MIKILTDSTADLPPELVEAHHISVIPLNVTIDDRTYMDNGVDIGRREFFDKLKAARKMPTTSQPSVGDFRRMFENLTADGGEVLCITISSAMSGTYQSACGALEDMPDAPVQIVDSRHVSIGLGPLVLHAARMVAAGQTMEDIIASVTDMIDACNLVFLVDTLEYLHKGGRIGTASTLMGTLLSVKPLLTVKDGIIQPLHKARSKKLAQKCMLSLLEERTPPGTPIECAMTHAVNPEDAGWFEEQIRARYDCKYLYVGEMGPVVGTHVGPGVVGIAIYPWNPSQ
jgi:DegV family protein with EDD domain